MTARHLTASVAVINSTDGTVLLVWHKATGKLMFPGGHVDPGETPFEAACREVCEETGLSGLRAFRTDPLIDLPGMRQEPSPWLTYEIPAPAKPYRGPDKPAEAAHSHIDMLFIGQPDGPETELRPAIGEVNSAEWVSIADLERSGRSRYNYRADVPLLAARALQIIRDGR